MEGDDGMARVDMSKLPKQRPVYTLDFPSLNGGLNLRDTEGSLKSNESPQLLNMHWQDGVLQARPGQEYATAAPSRGGQGFAVTDSPFCNHIFLHIGNCLYRLPQGVSEDDDDNPGTLPEPVFVASGIPANRGTFFRFGDWLFYKNRDGFFKIAYNANTQDFSVTSVTEDAFVPTIFINADPETGVGDIYQPENRLSAKKRVTYNAATADRTVTFDATGRHDNGGQAAGAIPGDSAQKTDGVRRAFNLGVTAADQLRGVTSVYIDAVFQPPALYSVTTGTGVIIFNAAPEAGSTITITLAMGTLVYHLPVQNVDSVDSVKVDGIEWAEGNDYEVDLNSGTVTFTQAPPVTDPPTNNSVEITYSKANPDALKAVMNCNYAAVYGSGNQLCIVLGGDTGRTRNGKLISQPNAVFWSGSTQNGFDPTYFPVDAYNLLGDTEDAVTGFGKQYDSFMVFKAHSIGRLTMEITTVNERNVTVLNYARVNDSIGCDLPRSIQLINNNLVFANTGLDGDVGGIYLITSSSAAFENNVECISQKMDGSEEHPGLLYDLEVAGHGPVSSHNDGRRYYLCVNNHVWLWNYRLSRAGDPTWFLWSGFHAIAWFRHGQKDYHLNDAGRVTRLGRIFSDYGEAIHKLYRFPVRYFGDYNRLKDVITVILSVRADVPSDTEISYETDYETRRDRVSLPVEGYDRLSERNLAERDLSVSHYSAVFRRKPMCRHIRNFVLTLENNTAGQDLSVLTAQIQYRFGGRDR